MTTASIYGGVAQSAGLYGLPTSTTSRSVFEWFIFYVSSTQPATPTGGSWDFNTETGTPPTGWTTIPPASPTTLVWLSIAIVNSSASSTITWSVPGQVAFSGPTSPITSTGDLIVGNGVNSATRLPIGSNGYVLTSNGTTATWSASTGGVTSFNSGSTGLTPNTATTGAVTLAGTLAVANGGTGQTTKAAAFNALSPITATGDLIVGNGTNSATRLGIGTNGYVLTSNGTTATWSASTGGVTSFSAGSTGLTPSTATTGAVSLAGTLAIANGGTGVTTSTGSGNNVLSTSPTITTPVISSLSSASATALTLQSAGTTAVTIDTSQNVGIGTTSPQGKLQVYASANDNLIITGHVNASDGPAIKTMDSTATNYKSCEILSAELRLGGQNNILFGTSGTGGSTERMRIDSSGNLLVGTTSQLSAEKLGVLSSGANQFIYFRNSNASSPGGQFINYSVATPNNTGSEFLFCNDPSQTRMTIRSNGGIANYSGNNVNLSDSREKTNFSPSKSYLDIVCAIPVQTFNYIDQNREQDDGLTLGVVAQDVQAVAPELVSESDWSSEKDGSKMRLSIYQTDLQYALMKSIQELKAINDTQAETINALTARIEALEAK